MTGILAGKRLLITGVLTESSIAFHTARLAQEQGATVVLTGYGRLSLVNRIARRLPQPAPVVELDVTDPAHLDSLADRVGAYVDGLDAGVAWPSYDWMGVAKAGLESCSRYLAHHLGPRGIRVNLVAAGPLRTVAARNIPGSAGFEEAWDTRAPLGWKADDVEVAARACVALLSDWFPATTGEIVHADGGYHAVGA
ncbi:enoyl-ACP reductase-like protein [Krasilnikovia cinnamomea]|uniref:Enoyl-ACP reductase-like protein n=1 Tax=Krasilnikovia cinnamomea TaxID=349313 RepID=A0A4Q7ZNR9_9ACTN|nr:SDR family oxidoreductase [Krasilnikovia cinnamomea]RZU52334.1 enoyl-ACP reductase-like protein [Krasilnikovia cinnamomea]